MSEFDYMTFCCGCTPTDFVTHAKKFTKQETLELFLMEEDIHFDDKFHVEQWHKPTEDDVFEARARYYPKVPDSCGFDCEGGCYSFCPKGERGSFPVFVIDLENLKQEVSE